MSSTPSMSRLVAILSVSVGLMMTGVGLVLPVYARRVAELGGGPATLAWMAAAFALAQVVFAPLAGSLADRWGRRPLVLLGLGAFAVLNVLYTLAPSTGAFIALRGLAGALTAGLFPAAQAIVADRAAPRERGRWMGRLMAGYMSGFILGPAIGGALFDGFGFHAPFLISAGLGAAGFAVAWLRVPETRAAAPRRAGSRGRWLPTWPATGRALVALLLLSTLGPLVFAMVEPQMVFTVYDDMGWSSLSFGLLVGAYGVAYVVGQTLLGGVSDRIGRQPAMVIGFLLLTGLYVGMALQLGMIGMALAAISSGIGGAIAESAVAAQLADLAPEDERSQWMGLKSSSGSLGSVIGPGIAIILATAGADGAVVYPIAAAALVLASAGSLLWALLTSRSRRGTRATSGGARPAQQHPGSLLADHQ